MYNNILNIPNCLASEVLSWRTFLQDGVQSCFLQQSAVLKHLKSKEHVVVAYLLGNTTML